MGRVAVFFGWNFLYDCLGALRARISFYKVFLLVKYAFGNRLLFEITHKIEAMISN